MPALTREEQLALVDQVRTGDQAAIATLYKATVPMLSRALARVVPQDDIDDLAQETMIRAFRNIDQFHGDALFTTWCVRIGVNQGISYLRKQKTVGAVVVDSIDRMMVGSDGSVRKAIDIGYEDVTANRNFAHAVVHGALDQLPERTRVAILMQKDGEKVEDIAEALGVEVSNAKSVLLRGKKAMRQIIEGDREDVAA